MLSPLGFPQEPDCIRHGFEETDTDCLEMHFRQMRTWSCRKRKVRCLAKKLVHNLRILADVNGRKIAPPRDEMRTSESYRYTAGARPRLVAFEIPAGGGMVGQPLPDRCKVLGYEIFGERWLCVEGLETLLDQSRRGILGDNQHRSGG